MLRIHYKATLQGTTALNGPLSGDSTCVLPISVGWYYHEDEYFYPTLDLVNKKFSRCRIVVCDTLQRYSLQFLEDNTDFEKYARTLGDQWLKRHLHRIEKLNIPYKIERWDDCKQNESYINCKKKIEDEIATNNSFAANFYQTATYIYNNFMLHGRINSLTTKKNRFVASSVAYLIEECAVVLTWEKEQETVLLYPKDLGKALYQTMNTFLGTQRNILQPLQIRFKKIGYRTDQV
jgi:hypothetical protein